MMSFKKNNLLLSFLLIGQLMQGCILDDMRDTIMHLWNKATARDVFTSCSQAITESESWLRAHSKQAAALVLCTALITYFIVNRDTKRSVVHHTDEFFTNFEQGQKEAYRQGWHDALAYNERMQSQSSVHNEVDPELIELQKAFQDLATLLNSELEIEITIEK